MDAAICRVVRLETAINFCTNFALNALCAWLIERRKPFVEMFFWNVCIDTWITCHFVCILTTLFCAWAARRYYTAGIFRQAPAGFRFLAELPRQPVLLAFSLAEFASFPLIFIFGFFFLFSGIEALAIPQYVFYKGAWGGTLGAVVCFTVLLRYLQGGVTGERV